MVQQIFPASVLIEGPFILSKISIKGFLGLPAVYEEDILIQNRADFMIFIILFSLSPGAAVCVQHAGNPPKNIELRRYGDQSTN